MIAIIQHFKNTSWVFTMILSELFTPTSVTKNNFQIHNVCFPFHVTQKHHRDDLKTIKGQQFRLYTFDPVRLLYFQLYVDIVFLLSFYPVNDFSNNVLHRTLYDHRVTKTYFSHVYSFRHKCCSYIRKRPYMCVSINGLFIVSLK